MGSDGDRLQIGTVAKLVLAFVLVFILLSLADAALARRDLRLGGETSFATVPTGRVRCSSLSTEITKSTFSVFAREVVLKGIFNRSCCSIIL